MEKAIASHTAFRTQRESRYNNGRQVQVYPCGTVLYMRPSVMVQVATLTSWPARGPPPAGSRTASRPAAAPCRPMSGWHPEKRTGQRGPPTATVAMLHSQGSRPKVHREWPFPPIPRVADTREESLTQTGDTGRPRSRGRHRGRIRGMGQRQGAGEGAGTITSLHGPM